uniref:Uncharacterized protein n=1 Tax=Physcomitrium patens TaxID=3218 RepID=A0A2K1IGB3_PHYPA|nr:hypothetical protein PHYPA_028907 [Physcomitrium patens]
MCLVAQAEFFNRESEILTRERPGIKGAKKESPDDHRPLAEANNSTALALVSGAGEGIPHEETRMPGASKEGHEASLSFLPRPPPLPLTLSDNPQRLAVRHSTPPLPRSASAMAAAALLCHGADEALMHRHSVKTWATTNAVPDFG